MPLHRSPIGVKSEPVNTEVCKGILKKNVQVPESSWWLWTYSGGGRLRPDTFACTFGVWIAIIGDTWPTKV
jgi:hypothetical protein